jgi:hypothetical protein
MLLGDIISLIIIILIGCFFLERDRKKSPWCFKEVAKRDEKRVLIKHSMELSTDIYIIPKYFGERSAVCVRHYNATSNYDRITNLTGESELFYTEHGYINDFYNRLVLDEEEFKKIKSSK